MRAKIEKAAICFRIGIAFFKRVEYNIFRNSTKEGITLRKWISVCCTVVLLLTVAACTSPFSLEPETETETSGPTFVITSKVHQGLDSMPDGINWQNNAFCAMEYLGTRNAYSERLQSLHKTYFSDVESSVFDAMPKADVGGDDVYLVVPRFDLEQVAVYSVVVDSEGKTHILRQVTETTDAFLLFCDSSDSPNAQLGVTLAAGEKVQRMRVLPQRDAQTGALSLPSGVQRLSKS